MIGTVEPPNNGRVGAWPFVHYSEVVHYSGAANVLVEWTFQKRCITPCPLLGGRPLLGVSVNGGYTVIVITA